jgi:hypothetical protein
VRSEQRRKLARKRWPIRRYALGEEPGEDLSATTTPEERVAMMWELAATAWRLSGKKFPNYPRRKAPIKIIRLPR